MPTPNVAAIRRPPVAVLVISAFALAVFAILPGLSYSQAPASVTAPTSAEDPALIDQIWQKASAKYDAPRTRHP